MKAYLKDVLEFAATVFCAIATNAIILFVVYLICGTLERKHKTAKNEE